MKKNKFYNYFIFFLIVFSACKTIDSPDREIGAIFFPNYNGSVNVFFIDSLQFNGFSGDSLRKKYYLKERYFFNSLEVTDSLFDVAVERSDDSMKTWQEINKYQILKNNSYILKIEKDEQTVLLSFPIAENENWNAHRGFSEIQELFTYKNVYDPVKTDYFQSNDGLRIEVINDSSRFFYERKYFVYAQQLGLLEMVDNNWQNQNNVKSGYELKKIKIE